MPSRKLPNEPKVANKKAPKGTLKLFVPPVDLLCMTRIPSLAAWTVLACATAFAASRAETATYVDGNLTGVSPNTGGTLLFSDDKTLVFRTGLTTVTTPYTAITRSELGATRETSHGGPAYKVWARKKKTETQFLTVEFKNDEGEARTMTLELAQATAPSVLAAIQEHTSKPETAEVASATPAAPEHVAVKAAPTAAPAPALQHISATSKPINDPHDKGAVASPATKPGSDWWGDDIWKTNRNASTWTKPTGTNAPED
jgi:hypothetical protein